MQIDLIWCSTLKKITKRHNSCAAVFAFQSLRVTKRRNKIPLSRLSDSFLWLNLHYAHTGCAFVCAQEKEKERQWRRKSTIHLIAALMAPARADIIKINRCAHPVQPRKRIGMHALFSTFLTPAAARRPEREPKPRQVEKFIARALCAATKHFYTRRESMERGVRDWEWCIRESEKIYKCRVHYVYSVFL